MLTKFGIHHILESCASVLRIILGDLSIAIHGEDVSANMDFVEEKTYHHLHLTLVYRS